MTAARLSIKDISVRFGVLMALESVGLELGDNQLLGFIGPNGAGKTTLMRVITGIVCPVSGQVMLDGRNISTLSSVERIHAGVALGQQIVKPLREMSLLDNVALAFGREKLLSPLRALSVRSRDAEREAADNPLRRWAWRSDAQTSKRGATWLFEAVGGGPRAGIAAAAFAS